MRRALVLALVCLGSSVAFADHFSADQARTQSLAAQQKAQEARHAFQAQQNHATVERFNNQIAARSKNGSRFLEVSSTTPPEVLHALERQGYKVGKSVYGGLLNVTW